ncbi:hypothetical protein GCM10009574_000850 [Streptomyces asiaticus]|uniref:Uncharacterized protein n=1 Tax=Streptomyces rhizosphaericus TaxID=114699 RepID=A0ABN1PSS6_9ACTN
MAFATAWGEVASGAGRSPAVSFVRTKPGRTTITWTPVPRSVSPSPRANASSPALAEAWTKSVRRSRPAAAEVSTTSEPWPWRRMALAQIRAAETAPV